MKTVFIFQTIHGWGKDYTLQGAMEKYEKANGKLKKADKFSVLVFKAKKAEDVGADMLNWHTENGAKFLAEG
jgi:hypothetical protein